MEFAVGAMLLGLGLWVLRGIAGAPELPLAHEHARVLTARGTSARGSGWVGAIHGVAGTGGFLALAPAAMLASPWLAGAYLALFSVGTMLAMGVYALGAGLIFQRVGSSAPSLVRLLRAAAGIASAVVGCAWMLAAAASAAGS